MTLSDLLERLDELDPELIIYAERNPDWNESSSAILREELAGGEVPDCEGKKYFLEVSVAKDVRDDWLSYWRRNATKKELFRAIVYYAVNDAYMPIPDIDDS